MRRRVFFVCASMTFLLALPARAEVGDAPVATISASSALDGIISVTFDQPVKRVTPSNVVLRAGGTTANLSGSVTCVDAGGSSVSCWAGPVSRARKHHPALIPGQRYAATVSPSDASPVTDMLGTTPVATTTKTFTASLVEEETSRAARYAWPQYGASAAYGGSYVAERVAGARVTFTFTGRSAIWYTKRGPNQGIATAYIDGARWGDINNYSSATAYKIARTFGGLSNATHRLTLVVTGRKSSRASSTWVTVDAWGVNGAQVAKPNAVYRWDAVADERATGDAYVRANALGARAMFTFRGKGIDWYTFTGPSQGKAEIWIDGVKRTTVDNYEARTRTLVRRPIAGLTDAVHTITVRALGTKNARSTGTTVVVDRFVVRLPSTTMFRGLGAWVDVFDYNDNGAGLDPAAATAAMKDRGVQTLYLQTARYNTGASFKYPASVGEWVDAAHAEGIKIVGWYLPAYDQYLDVDVTRTAAIATFRSPGGHGFDALAIDIEYKGETESLDEFNTGIVQHLQRVRSRVGNSFAVGAITPAPLGMAISPSRWAGFPWGMIGRYADVVMPMSYWTYRTSGTKTCSSDPVYCAYGYTRENTERARTYTGLRVHVIGGLAGDATTAQVADFVKGAKDERAYGGSLYDYRTTRSTYWAELVKLRV